MGNMLRHMKRQSKPHYSCHGRPMTYMPDQKVYFCEKCGKTKKVKEDK